MATEAILVVCRRCSSPFLQPCTAAGVARCRSCGWIHFLGAREVAADSFPVDPVTRIVVRDDLPPGTVLVTRYTPRLVCERLAQARDVVDPLEAGIDDAAWQRAVAIVEEVSG